MTLALTQGCPLREGASEKAGLMLDITPGTAVIYPFVDELQSPVNQRLQPRSLLIAAYPYTGKKILLFEGEGRIVHVASSPDGKHIAFAFESGDEIFPKPTPLYLLSIDDGHITRVSDLDPLAFAVIKTPSFSPGGKRLVFSAQDSSPIKQIRLFIYSLDDGSLFTPSGFARVSLDDNPPSVMSTGEILCTMREYASEGVKVDWQMVGYNFEKDTYRVLALFDKDSIVGVPLEGPDKKYIYFDYLHTDWTRHREVLRIPVEGGTPEMVFGEDYVIYLGGFTPDGKTAVLSYHGINKQYLAVGDIETGEMHLITGDDEDVELFERQGVNHVSPEGDRIITRYHDPSFNYWDIVVMDLEGGSRTNVSNAATYDEKTAAWISFPEGLKVPEGGYKIQ